METEIQETEVVKQELVIKLSINSVVRLTNPGTMKIKGMIRERSVVVLIDCGATHNFISENLVTQLLLSLEETSHYGVISGSESAVKGKGICKQVELLLSEWKVVDNFLPLELGGSGCHSWYAMATYIRSNRNRLAKTYFDIHTKWEVGCIKGRSES